jgi:thiol-disulfide isomerase/thioredoxin
VARFRVRLGNVWPALLLAGAFFSQPLLEQNFSKLKHPKFVIARLVRATHFVSYKKLGRPHEAGDDDCNGDSTSNDIALAADFPVLVPGATAPEFARPDIQGKPFDLKALRGRFVLLDFWASWCAPCVVEIPHLIDLQQRYGLRGLQVVGISLDESITPVKAVARRFAFNYPVLLGDAKLGENYGGILGLPVQFLVGPDGKILRIWKGELSPAVLEKTLKAALETR